MAAAPCCPRRVLLGSVPRPAWASISQGDWYLKRVREREREAGGERPPGSVLSSFSDFHATEGLLKGSCQERICSGLCHLKAPTIVLEEAEPGPGRLRAPPPHTHSPQSSAPFPGPLRSRVQDLSLLSCWLPA